MIKDYYKHDHSHCWNQKKPACGQKIKHFCCCLCGEPHPDIHLDNKQNLLEGHVKEWLSQGVPREWPEVADFITQEINTILDRIENFASDKKTGEIIKKIREEL